MQTTRTNTEPAEHHAVGTDGAGLEARGRARAAAEAAALAFPPWSTTPASERRRILERACGLLMERQAAIATLITEETGETIGWGMFNVEFGVAMLSYYATQCAAVEEIADLPTDIPGRTSKAVRQPVGTVLSIAPWNAPIVLAIRAIGLPLAYGNTVVLKASERCPRSHASIVSALSDAGLTSDALTIVTHTRAEAADVVDELIAHPAIRSINFTGSTQVGRIVAEKAARHLKRTLLELGGNTPFIVLADADVARAVAAATFGAFMNQGQICMSTQRVIVDGSIAEEFAEGLAARVAALRVGDPRDPNTQIGELVDDEAVERIAQLVDDAVSKGARIVTGGEADGRRFSPTVLMGLTRAMRLYSEEIFGPVVALIPVEGADEAVRVANDSGYGLSASIFTRDIDAGMALARRIESGMCHINDASINEEPQSPFGGVKQSGWGRFGGYSGLDEFTELRWITMQETPREYPL